MVYEWYISGIYCQLGDYMPPATFYGNQKQPLIKVPSLKLTANAPANGCLEYDPASFWGCLVGDSLWIRSHGDSSP